MAISGAGALGRDGTYFIPISQSTGCLPNIFRNRISTVGQNFSGIIPRLAAGLGMTPRGTSRQVKQQLNVAKDVIGRFAHNKDFQRALEKITETQEMLRKNAGILKPSFYLDSMKQLHEIYSQIKLGEELDNYYLRLGKIKLENTDIIKKDLITLVMVNMSNWIGNLFASEYSCDFCNSLIKCFDEIERDIDDLYTSHPSVWWIESLFEISKKALSEAKKYVTLPVENVSLHEDLKCSQEKKYTEYKKWLGNIREDINANNMDFRELAKFKGDAYNDYKNNFISAENYDSMLHELNAMLGKTVKHSIMILKSTYIFHKYKLWKIIGRMSHKIDETLNKASEAGWINEDEYNTIVKLLYEHGSNNKNYTKDDDKKLEKTLNGAIKHIESPGKLFINP